LVPKIEFQNYYKNTKVKKQCHGPVQSLTPGTQESEALVKKQRPTIVDVLQKKQETDGERHGFSPAGLLAQTIDEMKVNLFKIISKDPHLVCTDPNYVENG
jgi:hypothetical protein